MLIEIKNLKKEAYVDSKEQKKQKPKADLLNESTLSVSEIFTKMLDKDEKEESSIIEIINDLYEDSLLLALIFFSLPIAIPLPYPPGFSSVFAIPLIVLSCQMVMGKMIVILPKKIGNYKIRNSTLLLICKKAIPVVKYLEIYIKPRMAFPHNESTRRMIGVIALISSVSIFIPLPFTNAIPALSITLMSLGFLNKDGFLIIFGVVVSFIGIFIAFIATTSVFFIVKKVISFVFF